LRGGDVVLRFNGNDVKEMKSLPRIVADTRVGDTVPVVVWRDGKEVNLQVTVGELPDDATLAAQAPAAAPRNAPPHGMEVTGLGLQVSPISKELRDKFSLSESQTGVVITNITDSGAAADRGLKVGDVIVEVQQEQVSTPADVQAKIEAARKLKRKTVLMLVQSADGLHWVPLSLDGSHGPG
jgi:serine protease Do